MRRTIALPAALVIVSKKMLWRAVLVVGMAVAYSPTARADLLIPTQASDKIVTTTGDDEAFDITAFFSAAIPGGFPFFATNQTSLFMSTNGNLTFGAGNTANFNVSFPTGAPPRIAPFWDDLILVIPPNNLRVNSSTPGVLNAIWNDVETFDLINRMLTFEATLLGAGNPFGATPGTIVLSYAQITGTQNFGTATVGLNQGDGAGFATLASLGIGAADGQLNTFQARALPNTLGGIFFFTPVGDGYVVSAVPEPASVVLLVVGALGALGYRLRSRAGGTVGVGGPLAAGGGGETGLGSRPLRVLLARLLR